ncbi:MAG: hypothetical protein RL020_1189 [Pseudomonadota bacterium]|jgi:hypothetical protein
MTKIVKYNQILTIIIADIFLSVPSFAQTQVAPQQIEKIEVKGLRDPGMMPYKEAYAYLQKINANPHDKIAVRMRVVPVDKNLSLRDIKITLQGDKTSRVIPIADDGLIEVPLEKALIEDNAEFISNQKKNSLQVHVNVDVLLPSNGALRYRYLSDALNQARDSVKSIVPWYVRWLVPNSWNAVDIEFAEPGKATAAIMATSGKQVFRADKDKLIKLLLDDYLITENPEVVFSTPPTRIGAGMINDMLSYQAQKSE